MTTEDLILGHFDGTLTPTEEARLNAEIKTSQEVRALYEQHRSLHAMLSADAAALSPSSRLDKAVVAAALSAVPETIGSGALSWLTGKVAFGISAAVIGGLSIAILSNSGSDNDTVPAATAPAPVVRSAPSVQSAPIPPATVESPKSDANRMVESPAPKAEAPGAEMPGKEPSRSASARSGNSGTVSQKDNAKGDRSGQRKPALKLDSRNPTTIVNPPTVLPTDKK